MTLAEAIAEITRLQPLATKGPWEPVAGFLQAYVQDEAPPVTVCDTFGSASNAAIIALLRNVIVPLLDEREAMRGALDHSLFGMDAKESREWEAQARTALNLANQPLP